MTNVIKTIDVVTSARNEEGNVSVLYNRVLDAAREAEVEFRLIICDNRSEDGTWSEIVQLGKTFPGSVIGLRLSRDFGAEPALRAGLEVASADAVVVIASDLQDNPAWIKNFVSELRSGVDHVYQVVDARPDESRVRVLQARVFYALAGRLTGGLIVPNSSTYRAFTAKVLRAIRSMPEKAGFLRGLAMYVGFTSKGLPFPRDTRSKGKSKAAGPVVLRLALRGIVSNSSKPLDFIGIFGLALGLIAIATTGWFSVLWLTQGVPFAGYGTLVGILLLAMAGLFFALGVISQYLSLIYEEVKGRPTYIVEESVGLNR